VTATSDWRAEPESFIFSDENKAKIEKIVAKYPDGRQASAVLPLLDLAQRQAGGWLPRVAIEHVAEVLGMPPIQVQEVVSFYTMLHDKPVGKHVVWVCTNIACMLRGSDDVLAACEAVTGVKLGQTTEDGLFTLREQECLGACCNAPMVQIDDDFYEDLTAETTTAVLDAFKRGETPKPSSQTGRHTSEPAGGLTTLKDTPVSAEGGDP
jgi:NADH-quinone oxidoreductase E subunit